MNRFLLRTAAFAAALLMTQASVSMNGISALHCGDGDEVLTEYTESVEFYHYSGQYGYFLTEPGKATADYNEYKGLKLSWDTDSEVLAGLNYMQGMLGVPLDKLPLKNYYRISNSYSLKLDDVSGFAAYGTDLQFSCNDVFRHVLIADGYTDEDIPYDITPKTVRIGNAEYKLYEYTENRKVKDYEYEEHMCVALPVVNGYRAGQLLSGKRDVSEVIDLLIEAGLVSSEESLEDSGFGIIIPADSEHPSSGNAELVRNDNILYDLKDAYSKTTSVEELGSVINFYTGEDADGAYMFRNIDRNVLSGFNCFWDASDEVSAEYGRKTERKITPLTEAVVETAYEADIEVTGGGFIFGALCTFAGNVSPFDNENVYRVLIADICSNWNTDNLQSLGSVTVNGTKYNVYLESGKMIYALPSGKNDDVFASGVYSGEIDVLSILRAMAKEGCIAGNVPITAVYSKFSAVPEASGDNQEIINKGSINLTSNYVNIFKSNFTAGEEYDSRFVCDYSTTNFTGQLAAPSSLAVQWENERNPNLFIKREFDLKDGWEPYGELTAEYDIDYKGSKYGEIEFGVYGESRTEDGRIKSEFLVTDMWDNHEPVRGLVFPDGHDEVITTEIDGAVYDIFFFPYSGQMPDAGGVYCSVRRENLINNHNAEANNSISLSRHFDEWRKLGYTDGDKCDIGFMLTGSSIKNVECKINSYDVYGSDEKEETVIVMGDADGNGIINTVDLITIVRYLTGNGEIDMNCIDSVDMNSDGSVNLIDLILLKKILIN